MWVNHVRLGDGSTVVDIRDTTVTPDTAHKGAVFYGADGERREGSFDLTPELTEQRDLIDQLLTALEGKAAGGAALPAQEKAVEITRNGTVEVVPDEGYTLSKVAVTVDVPSGGNLDGIPPGYARVDYILFSGLQIVDTGIICNQDTAIQTCFTREASSQKYLYGCASSGNTASVTAYLGGTWRFGDKAATKSTGTINPNISYGAYVDKATIGVAGAVSSISGVADFETPGTLVIGTNRTADGTISNPQFVGKLFYFVMRKADEVVLKLIPVVSAEGVYRFFDVVSQTFFDSLTDTPLEGGNL